MPGLFMKNGAKASAYKRLAKKLAPETNCAFLIKLATADQCGRNPQKGNPLSVVPHDSLDAFYEMVEELGVLYAPEPGILMGADLLDSVKPGPGLGNLLERAYKIQIEEGITDKEILKSRVLKKEQE